MRSDFSKESSRKTKGFTLVELLVSMGILSILLLLLTQLLGHIQTAWVSSQDRVGQFREARVAFDIITKNISQASLNTYLDYRYNEDNLPDRYERRSELHFKSLDATDLGSAIPGSTPVGQAVFFQAPLGFSNKYPNLNNLFNGRGYFVVYGGDDDFRPSFVTAPPKYRYRLMEFRPPAEENQVFADGLAERERGGEASFESWWKHRESSVVSEPFFQHVHPLAENIVLLVVSPRTTLEESGQDRRDTYSEVAPSYHYDSNEHPNGKYKQQIPPLVRVTMVAIDEGSGIRIENAGGAPPLNIPSNLFSQTSQYDKDIETLSTSLNDQNIGYRVFSTMVMLRSAKWSESDDLEEPQI